MRRYIVSLDVAGFEAAVHGLVATTDDGAALLTRLEALLDDGAVNHVAPPPAPRRPILSPEAVAVALRESGGNVSAAARALGYSRAAVREKAALYLPTAASPLDDGRR